MNESSVYEVEYTNRIPEQLSAKIIAENMLSKFDSEGHHYQVLTKVIYHKIDYSVILKVDGFIKSINGNIHWKRMTCSWKLLVEWMDGSVDWFPLKDLKRSILVELDEYYVANEISDKPAFSWWVKKTLRCQDMIISKIKYMYWHRSHKFEIRVTKTLKEAYGIDRQSRTEFWTKVISK